jgi:ParB-like chromosome segregation protein Spo0J
MVPIEKVFLRNKQLDKNPKTQRESPFYQKVRDSIKKRGIINPLLCIETEECEGQKYMCCIGNNRYLAAHELGIKEVPIKIVMSEIPTDLMAATKDYTPTEVEGYPPRAREYERIKNEDFV